MEENVQLMQELTELHARLDALGSVPVVLLRASELEGGFTFSVRLIVIDIMGVHIDIIDIVVIIDSE